MNAGNETSGYRVSLTSDTCNKMKALTLQPLSFVALDHDAELQHQLRGAL